MPLKTLIWAKTVIRPLQKTIHTHQQNKKGNKLQIFFNDLYQN